MSRELDRGAPSIAATVFLLNLLVFGNLKVADASPVESSTSIEEFPSRFSWDIATDNPASYNVIPLLDLDKIVEQLSETEPTQRKEIPSRQKRASNFGKRVHVEVPASIIYQAPYSGAVRVSDDCSGTLISNHHVLTAAHCVHDGKRHKYKLPLLKVGIMRRNGKFHWIKVIKIHIPDAWKESRGRKGPSALDGDFAVLRLKRGHGQNFLALKKSDAQLTSVISFNGFPGDKGGTTMWHSSCRVEKVIRNIFLSRCSASTGSSGSGIYISLGGGKYAVTGIVSAAIKVRKGRRRYSFTVTTRLTAAKVKVICRWTGRKDC